MTDCLTSGLAAILDPANLFVNLVGSSVVLFAFFFFLALVLPPRNVRAYWAVVLVGSPLLLLQKPIMMPEVRLAVFLAFYLLVAMMMLKGPFFTRLLVALLGIAAQIVGELMGALLWTWLTGLGMVEYKVLFAHPASYLVSIWVGTIGPIAVVMSILRAAVARIGHANAPEAMKSSSKVPARILLFPALQMAMTAVLCVTVESFFAYDLAHLVPTIGLMAICVGADGLLLYQVSRFYAHSREEERIRVQEEEIASSIQHAAPLQILLADTARLRHDLRNHKLVVEQLCAKGQSTQAQAYLDALALEMPPLPKDPIDRNAGNPPANPASPGLPPN